MSDRVSIQVYVPSVLATWVRTLAGQFNVSNSDIVKGILLDAWHAQEAAGGAIVPPDPMRQNVFVAIALDALLKAHSDPQLRQLVMDSYNRRIARLGLSAASIQGGEDEK